MNLTTAHLRHGLAWSHVAHDSAQRRALSATGRRWHRRSLPRIGERPAPAGTHLSNGSSVVGRTLAALDLRGVTGATVLAISRAGGAVMVPTAQETLRAGDVVTLAGTTEAVEAARVLLDSAAGAVRGKMSVP